MRSAADELAVRLAANQRADRAACLIKYYEHVGDQERAVEWRMELHHVEHVELGARWTGEATLPTEVQVAAWLREDELDTHTAALTSSRRGRQHQVELHDRAPRHYPGPAEIDRGIDERRRELERARLRRPATIAPRVLASPSRTRSRTRGAGRPRARSESRAASCGDSGDGSGSSEGDGEPPGARPADVDLRRWVPPLVRERQRWAARRLEVLRALDGRARNVIPLVKPSPHDSARAGQGELFDERLAA